MNLKKKYKVTIENPEKFKTILINLYFSNNSTYQEVEFRPETSLMIGDILPEKGDKYYDKNRAPKLSGQPTIVYFHVTVLSLDSINEESMVIFLLIFTLFFLIRHIYFQSS